MPSIMAELSTKPFLDNGLSDLCDPGRIKYGFDTIVVLTTLGQTIIYRNIRGHPIRGE